MPRPGFDRTRCVKEVLMTCQIICQQRKKKTAFMKKDRRNALASKLRQLRRHAWMYFLELPEVRLSGGACTPWRFASIRVRR